MWKATSALVSSSTGSSGALTPAREEFVALKVDVIVLGNEEALRATKLATNAIPIVMISGADPVAGLIDSLEPAGWNVTGVAVGQRELVGFRLELLRLLPEYCVSRALGPSFTTTYRSSVGHYRPVYRWRSR
jgi:ABC-type uncharacterized transport system substrate-binding protein